MARRAFHASILTFVKRVDTAFLFLIDDVEEPRGWLGFYVPEDCQEFNP
jgi:hypothetical protein